LQGTILRQAHGDERKSTPHLASPHERGGTIEVLPLRGTKSKVEYNALMKAEEEYKKPKLLFARQIK